MTFIHTFLLFFFFFSLNTPPGTKVKLLGTVQVKNGLLLLDESKISVLGGEVDHMVEKWELQRVRVDFLMMAQLLLLKKYGIHKGCPDSISKIGMGADQGIF